MSNRRLFLLIGGVVFAFITFWVIVGIQFAICSRHVGGSYNDRSYYESREFIEASILTWHEFSNSDREITWLTFDDDTKEYYIAGGHIIISPSANVRYLIDHGALGLSFSGNALMIYDYMDYCNEKGCIVKPLSATNENCDDILWEASGFIAYRFWYNR
ncbi:MAG: hypothetical protein Q4G19_06370 [Clostridia bacterium]|nr:hypothetical protein [Clostridia bacterium]